MAPRHRQVGDELGAAGGSLAEDSAEVSAADFADLVGREALVQHLADHRGEKSSGQVWVGLVGALTLARGEQVCVGANTDVVDAHRVHHRLDAFDEFFQRVGELGPDADYAAGVSYDLGVFFADEPGFIISAIRAFAPVRLLRLV